MRHLPIYRNTQEYRQFLFRYLKANLTSTYNCIEYDNLIDGIALRLCFTAKSDIQVRTIFRMRYTVNYKADMSLMSLMDLQIISVKVLTCYSSEILRSGG